MRGWECQETDRGVPFFIHKTDGKTDWDHPYYTKVIEELDAYQEVRYAAYRTALKLRHLQKKFGLHLLSLQYLQAVFADHGYGPGQGELMDSQCLQLILLDLFHTPQFRHFDSFRQDQASDLLHNFILNLFDLARTGVVKVLSVKLTLAALCNDNLADKYRYFFREIQSSRAFVSRDQLSRFVSELIQIPDLLRESVAFGKNVSAAVDSCMQVAGTLGDGVPEKGFYQWLMREPQTLIWLPTLHRLIAAEEVKHDCKCSVCKATPMVGFRYKCLQCFKFNICQECFFHCRVAKNHQVKHPIQEYCFPTSAKDETKAFFKVLANKVSRRKRGARKTAFLPVDSSPDQGMTEWEMRAAPTSPPSPPSPHQGEGEGGVGAVAGGNGEEMSNDSGNSSDQGGEQREGEPSSPSRPSMYDNSSSPARYLEEVGWVWVWNRLCYHSSSPARYLEEQCPKSGGKQDRHSLLHLVHHLRRENRLLRQQLRSASSQGDPDPDPPQETWRSVATAQVTNSQQSGTLGSSLSSFPHCGRSATSASLSQTVSPICDLSIGDSQGQTYTSDFFNSILAEANASAAAATAAAFDITAQGADLKSPEDMVFASTPAVQPAVSSPQKPGPRKPPRLTGLGERNTASLSYILPEDGALEGPGRPTPMPLTHRAQVHCQARHRQPGRGASLPRSPPTRYCASEAERTSPALGEESSVTWTPQGGKSQMSWTPQGGKSQVSWTPQGGKSQVSCEEMWADVTPCTIRKKAAKPRRLAKGALAKGADHSLTADDSFTPSDKSRRKSTGSLLYQSVSEISGADTIQTPPRVLKSYGSLDRLGLRTPGVDKSLFAVSRGDSILKTPERAEIDKMIDWIDHAFPPDLSYSALSLDHEDFLGGQRHMLRDHDSLGGQRHMLRAAESIGHAMADLVQATSDHCYM
ncbi:hypothetical protein ACOMHN_001621 [Nucella lapillus]